MRKVLLAAALIPMACSTVPVTPAASTTTPGVCNNEGLSRFVGQPKSGEMQTQLLSASGARVIRWVEHGMMVTMDFREDRVTVRLGPDHRIASVSCG